MKLGFKRGTNWYSAVNRTVLNSQWSHSVVAIQTEGVWRLYESAALKGKHHKAGVRDYVLTPEIEAEYTWIDIGTSRDAEALTRYKEVCTYSYDYISLLSFLPVLNVRDADRMYCHELVLWLIGGHSKWRTTPEIILLYIITERLICN